MSIKDPHLPKAFHVLEGRQHNGRPTLTLPYFLPIKTGRRESRRGRCSEDRKKEKGRPEKEERKGEQKKKKKQKTKRKKTWEETRGKKPLVPPLASPLVAFSSTGNGCSHHRSAFLPFLFFSFFLLRLTSMLSTVHIVWEQWRALFMAWPILAQLIIWAQPKQLGLTQSKEK